VKRNEDRIGESCLESKDRGLHCRPRFCRLRYGNDFGSTSSTWLLSRARRRHWVAAPGGCGNRAFDRARAPGPPDAPGSGLCVARARSQRPGGSSHRQRSDGARRADRAGDDATPRRAGGAPTGTDRHGSGQLRSGPARARRRGDAAQRGAPRRRCGRAAGRPATAATAPEARRDRSTCNDRHGRSAGQTGGARG
jgi:hypothetical protein